MANNDKPPRAAPSPAERQTERRACPCQPPPAPAAPNDDSGPAASARTTVLAWSLLATPGPFDPNDNPTLAMPFLPQRQAAPLHTGPRRPTPNDDPSPASQLRLTPNDIPNDTPRPTGPRQAKPPRTTPPT